MVEKSKMLIIAIIILLILLVGTTIYRRDDKENYVNYNINDTHTIHVKNQDYINKALEWVKNNTESEVQKIYEERGFETEVTGGEYTTLSLRNLITYLDTFMGYSVANNVLTIIPNTEVTGTLSSNGITLETISSKSAISGPTNSIIRFDDRGPGEISMIGASVECFASSVNLWTPPPGGRSSETQRALYDTDAITLIADNIYIDTYNGKTYFDSRVDFENTVNFNTDTNFTGIGNVLFNKTGTTTFSNTLTQFDNNVNIDGNFTINGQPLSLITGADPNVYSLDVSNNALIPKQTTIKITPTDSSISRLSIYSQQSNGSSGAALSVDLYNNEYQYGFGVAEQAGILNYFSEQTHAFRTRLGVGNNISLGESLFEIDLYGIDLSASGAYKRFKMDGGNSISGIYTSFPQLGDGIHIGYNAYVENGSWLIPNTGGQTTRLSINFNSLSFFISDAVNVIPNVNKLNISLGVTSLATSDLRVDPIFRAIKFNNWAIFQARNDTLVSNGFRFTNNTGTSGIFEINTQTNECSTLGNMRVNGDFLINGVKPIFFSVYTLTNPAGGGGAPANILSISTGVSNASYIGVIAGFSGVQDIYEPGQSKGGAYTFASGGTWFVGINIAGDDSGLIQYNVRVMFIHKNMAIDTNSEQSLFV